MPLACFPRTRDAAVVDIKGGFASSCGLPAAHNGAPRRADQQPSYGAQLDWPPAAMALLNTWFCSATLAFPKSAGLPP